MSSKSTRQSLTLLAVIGGCLIQIIEDKMFSVLSMRQLSKNCYAQVILTMQNWPKSSDYCDDAAWINNKIDLWKIHIDTVQSFYKAVVLVTICDRCLLDVLSQINNPYKRSLLHQLVADITTLREFVDPEGNNFSAYDKTEEIMNYLYSLIEWEWKK
jgi:hypothetical protein